MTKISIIFKPQKSWIACELQKNWFIEIKYHNIVSWKINIKNKLKILVAWVPYDEIADFYENADRYFNKEAVILFMCPISSLFE